MLSGWITSVRDLWVEAYGRANIPGCGGMGGGGTCFDNADNGDLVR